MARHAGNCAQCRVRPSAAATRPRGAVATHAVHHILLSVQPRTPMGRRLVSMCDGPTAAWRSQLSVRRMSQSMVVHRQRLDVATSTVRWPRNQAEKLEVDAG